MPVGRPDKKAPPEFVSEGVKEWVPLEEVVEQAEDEGLALAVPPRSVYVLVAVLTRDTVPSGAVYDRVGVKALMAVLAAVVGGGEPVGVGEDVSQNVWVGLRV